MGIDELLTLGRPGFTLLAFLWGACVGSFLNVCIYRIPRRLSVVAPRSFCPGCRKPIAWYDNVPMVSWLLLRARCRRCGASISPRYAVVECLTALLFVLAWLAYGPESGGRVLGLAPVLDPALVLVHWVAIGGLLLGAFVDCRHLIIPDRVSLGGIAAGLLSSLLVPALHGAASPAVALVKAAGGAAFGFGLLWLIAQVGRLLFRKEAMGFGDVKLMGAMGAFFGMAGVLFVLFVASLLGAVFGLFFIATGRRKLGRHIPFGPYLVTAALLWIFWGPRILAVYTGLLMPEAAG